MAVAGLPGALASLWLVPSGSLLFALAVPLAAEMLGAALALWRVPPFPWLEAKLSKKEAAN